MAVVALLLGALTHSAGGVKGQPSAAGKEDPSQGGQRTSAAKPERSTTLEPRSAGVSTEVFRLEVAHAVMVTVELDFGPKPPSIADALAQIERKYKPADGAGRTFAILDAYGEPASNGKLHISMHVSAEKPGEGSLVFKRTGEVLWRSEIVQGTSNPSAVFAQKGLIILMDDGAGHTVTVDGSKNPRSILEANVKEMGVPVHAIWPEGNEREMSFLYSACGCPVKVKAVRSGEKTLRTSELPVMFPDDPAAAAVIKKLMAWD